MHFIIDSNIRSHFYCSTLYSQIKTWHIYIYLINFFFLFYISKINILKKQTHPQTKVNPFLYSVWTLSLAYLKKKPTSQFPLDLQLRLPNQAKLLCWFELKVRKHKLLGLQFVVIQNIRRKKDNFRCLDNWREKLQNNYKYIYIYFGHMLNT